VETSLKKETEVTSIVLVSVPSSLKNETEVTSIVLISVPSSLKNEIVFPPLYLSQVLHLVFEASFHSPLQLDEMKLGGHFLTASGLHAEV
jgi:hypothetical protein